MWLKRNQPQPGIERARQGGAVGSITPTPVAAVFVLLAGLAAILFPTLNLAATLDAGFHHTCAVTGSGGLKCWGEDSYYQLGDGTDVTSASPVDVLDLGANVTDVATGGFFTCALTAGGAVECWGYNSHGETGTGSNDWAVMEPTQVVGLDSGTQAITAGLQHSCALSDAGAVSCWGGNTSGALGDDTEMDSNIPVSVVGLDSEVTAIEAGRDFTCALTTDGGVKCWGENGLGQLGDGTHTDQSMPVDVFGLSSGVLALAAGDSHACAVQDTGRVACWGDNSSGQFGNGTEFGGSSIPMDASSLDVPATGIAANWLYTCAVTDAGAVKCWGYNASGQLGDGTITSRLIATDVASLQSGVVELTAGWQHACVRMNNDELKCWGDGSSGQLGTGVPFRRTMAVDVANLESTAAITGGAEHSCALSGSGAVACWGGNASGELGDGTESRRKAPVQVIGLDSGIQMVAAGQSHSCAVTNDNHAVCWGGNYAGQLGDGSLENRLEPVSVANLGSHVAAIGLGSTHTCALTTEGSVQCWGDNFVGQLGNGSSGGAETTPVQVVGLDSEVTQIALGSTHSCALTVSGGVKCWGQNATGALGDGTNENRSTPVNVVGLADDIIAISAGEWSSCALTEIGTVKCWGDGRLSPVEIDGFDQPATALSAGGSHYCAIIATTGLQCWGSNSFGQLGDGTILTRNAPVDVVGLTSGVSMIAAGQSHTCAVTETGVAKCWGSNALGQLGNGEAGYALTPQLVEGTPFSFLIFRNGFE